MLHEGVALSFCVGFMSALVIILVSFYIHKKRFMNTYTDNKADNSTETTSNGSKLLTLVSKSGRNLALGMQGFLHPLRLLSYAVLILAFLFLLEKHYLHIVAYFIGLTACFIVVMSVLFYKLFRGKTS